MEQEVKNRKKKRMLLKRLLFGKTKCAIQHDGWCCNTCFHAMNLGISNDYLHELWLSTLLLRGDYKNDDNFYQSDEIINQNVDKLISLLMETKAKDYNISDGEVRQCNKCGILDIFDTSGFTMKEMEKVGIVGHSNRCDGIFIWKKVSKVK